MQKHANQFTALQHELPSKIEPVDPCLLDQHVSYKMRALVPMVLHDQKKSVPYKRTPGFHKINKSYKNTARLQKHVPKMGLGIQFSY
jgi:hypothetical protein